METDWYSVKGMVEETLKYTKITYLKIDNNDGEIIVSIKAENES